MNHHHHKTHPVLKNELLLLGIICLVVIFITVMVTFIEDPKKAMIDSVSSTRDYASVSDPVKSGFKKINGIVVFYEGDSMVQVPDVGMSLPDGTKIEKDGTVKKVDGKKVVLQNGQSYELE